MLDSLTRRATPAFITILTLALTVGTVFAQEGEEASSPSGLTLLILLIGIGALGAIFLVNWSQSMTESEDTDQ